MKLLFSLMLVVLRILPILAQNPQVKSVGEFRKIMHDADLSSCSYFDVRGLTS